MHPLDRLLAEARRDVAVDVQGHRHVAVPQPLLDDLGWDPVLEGERRVGVPRLVEGDRLDPRAPEDPREVAVDDPSAERAVYCSVILGSKRSAVS